jgi:CRISPR system Cascade subunit CasD
MRDTLVQWPAIASPRPGAPPTPRILSLESADRSGLMKMDQPLSSFDERRFGPRFVVSEVLDVPVQTGP